LGAVPGRCEGQDLITAKNSRKRIQRCKIARSRDFVEDLENVCSSIDCKFTKFYLAAVVNCFGSSKIRQLCVQHPAATQNRGFSTKHEFLQIFKIKLSLICLNLRRFSKLIFFWQIWTRQQMRPRSSWGFVFWSTYFSDDVSQQLNFLTYPLSWLSFDV